MKKVKPCPFCNGEAELRTVGDNKQFYAYFCSKCGKTPVNFNEARLTRRGAKKMWNKRAI